MLVTLPLHQRRRATTRRAGIQGFDPTNQALAGLALGSLVIGVLGVLAMTGEYGSGTIRSSLAAMPRRAVFFAAKAIVVGAAAARRRRWS